MNLATIGTGWITKAFVEAAAITGRYNLEAVYSRDIYKAKAFAENNGANLFYDDFSRLTDDNIDVVYIASPNSLHYEQAEYFLNHGKHVICEKPIVTKKGQFKKLFETANENGLYLLEGLRHLHVPGFAVIETLVNEIAPVRGVFLSYNQYSSKYDAFKIGIPQNVFDKSFDGGAKYDLGVYPLSIAAALFGRPNKSISISIPLENGVDGAGSYLLDYGSFVCNIAYSKTSDDIVLNEIIGENGGVRFDKPTSLAHVELCVRNGLTRNVSPAKEENNMRYEADVFADIIEHNDVESYIRLTEISEITNELLVERV